MIPSAFVQRSRFAREAREFSAVAVDRYCEYLNQGRGQGGRWSTALIMDLEFRQTKLTDADIRKLQAAAASEPFAADVLSGWVKFRECVHDGRVVGHCIGNSRTGGYLASRSITTTDVEVSRGNFSR